MASSEGHRMRVYYVEDGERVAYTGTVTARDPAQGLYKIWFDGMLSSEQEDVDANDEWEWMEEEVQLAPGEEALPLTAVRMRMKDTHEELPPLFIRLPAAPQSLAAGSLSGTMPSPHSFGKKARTLAAGALDVAGASPSSRPAREAASGARLAAQAAAAPISDRAIAKIAGAAGAKRKSPEEKVARPERKTHPSRSGKRKPKDPAAVAAAADAAAAAAAEEAAASAASMPAVQPSGPPSGGRSAGAPPAAPSAPAGVRAAVASTLKVLPDGPMLLLPEAVAERAIAAMTQRAEAYPPEEAAKYGICALSGLPARYRDPLTGTRYGSLAAFKQLRAQHATSEA